ncbi:hypothetical protein [Ruminococcus sp.]|uniref:hypothetical protein n=1 Tax=Ruminococcus sp. TaxID=41978 RepID=UPI0026003433|nr:hypothetical protein [Ruminococcus sp.]MBQ8965370.1 M50 family metallopeptidase [Ruminococcus sp.]
MKNKKLKNFIMIAAGMLIGGVLGLLLMQKLNTDTGTDRSAKILRVAVLLISLVVSYFAGIIIHEGGHLVMGLLTGYKFVSFRIGSFILVKQNGKFVIRRFSLSGTAGQCLMTHDMVEKDEDIPYFWYNAGGGLFNLLTFFICGLVCLYSDNGYVHEGFALAAIISAWLGVVNLIPLGALGLANDGANILDQYRSIKLRRLILNILIINSEQSQGKLLVELPEELFEYDGTYQSNISMNLKLMKVSRLLEEHRFEEAKTLAGEIADNSKIMAVLINEAKCELLFCKIVTGCPPHEIDELYDDDLKKYITLSGKTMISRRRLMYAYYYIYRQDKMNADKEYNLAVKVSENYSNTGVAKSEMSVIEYIKENY